ncbi:unnamed protein product [Phaedon cochleariae]|uniref:Capsid protein n=1 Tax=Phaedon cochleariae TaxID=80249 RepID=A0A9P0DRY1_PHACE|nr:unnamed protein product [Phaedon cochleariae]
MDTKFKTDSTPNAVSEVIETQINNVRDLDSETSRPRIEKSRPLETKGKIEHKPKSKPAKESSSLSTILKPYLRTPLTGNPFQEISTFFPSAYNMYYIVHIMDDILRKNIYFRRQEDAWHPFISRLYFGIVFYIQTLRAELKSGIISPAHRRFLTKFLRDYPPETLPIPGPLTSTFEALDCSTPPNSLVGLVTPQVPKTLVALRARQLFITDEGHSGLLAVPYIPGILGFINKMLTAANADQVPDYTVTQGFDDTVERTLNGSIFAPGAWTPVQRTTLLLPGMLYSPETNRDIDATFYNYGKRLNLPVPAAEDLISSLPHFLYLNRDNTWFGKIVQIMGTYSTYFRASSSLAECSAKFTASPLIISEYTKTSAQTAALNPLNTLTHAFPNQGVFTFECSHKTYETSLPPAATMVAQSAKLNVMTQLPNLGNFSLLGHFNVSRHGPYWTRTPYHQTSAKEETWKSIGSIVSEKYALSRPRPPRD